MSNRCLSILRGPIAEAYALLPDSMRGQRADVMLLAIGLQESGMEARDQRESPGGKDLVLGPALGLWQFERGGVSGVLTHKATRAHAVGLCQARGVTPEVRAVWEALKHDDVLAAGFARLNLWWLPRPLPQLGEQDTAWSQYLQAWRPGKPRPAEWPGHYREALATVAEACGG